MEMFHKHKPHTFTRIDNPTIGDDCLEQLKEIFKSRNFPNNQKVALAYLVMEVKAGILWHNLYHLYYEVHNNIDISWEDFEKVLREWCVTLSTT